MIDKFKKGGQNTSILAKIQQLPKEQQQQVMQAFSQWAQQKGVDIQKLQKDPNALEQALGQFMQELQSQKTQAAKHGAKLNYLKSLKNKCAEDEELVYFKKGGSIDCGCKKKEVGGKVQSAQNGAVAKFKNDKKTNQIKWTDKDEKKLDSLSIREGMNKPLTPQGKKDLKNLREKFKKSSNTKDYEVEEGKNGTKINKICGGSVISKFKAKCGSKLKKHQQGGSLNGIPFYQEGTFKGGIQVPGGRTQEEVDAINTQNKNNAKGLFKGMVSGQIVPTLPNLGRMISSAYKGYIDPETTAITGVAPTVQPVNYLPKFSLLMKLAKKRGGWYLFDENSKAQKAYTNFKRGLPVSKADQLKAINFLEGEYMFKNGGNLN